MLTPAKLAANRANARASTGPRTAAGKARSARNARRHGLRVPVVLDAAVAPDIKAFAQLLAGEGASPELYEFACRAAETQIDFVRVRTVRLMVYAQDPEFAEAKRTTRELATIDSYERRIWSRRNRALRAFVEACFAAGGRLPPLPATTPGTPQPWTAPSPASCWPNKPTAARARQTWPNEPTAVEDGGGIRPNEPTARQHETIWPNEPKLRAGAVPLR